MMNKNFSQSQLNQSPYKSRAALESNHFEYNNSPLKRQGPKATIPFTTSGRFQQESWLDQKNQIRSDVKSKVIAVQSSNQNLLQKTDILFGFDKKRSNDRVQTGGFLGSTQNSTLNHTFTNLTLQKKQESRQFISSIFSPSLQNNKLDFQDIMNKKDQTQHRVEKFIASQSGVHLIKPSYSGSYYRSEQASPSKVHQKSSFLTSVENKFPGPGHQSKNRSMDLEYKINNASYQSVIQNQQYAEERQKQIQYDQRSKFSSQINQSSDLGELLKMKGFKPLQERGSASEMIGFKPLQERVSLSDIVRISNQLQDIRLSEIPNLSSGYVQELLGLQNNIQRILKNNKQFK